MFSDIQASFATVPARGLAPDPQQRQRSRETMRTALLLNGFMGTGKTTVGRSLADRTGRPFIDLDQLVEARAGQSVEAIFRSRGEPAFRALEREALDSVLVGSSARAPVVALGGGALLDRSTRLRALEHATIVTLQASPEEIKRRVGDASSRPLLAGNPEFRIRELLESRAPGYAECHAQLETDGRSPASLAEKVHELWQRRACVVALGERSYVVEFGQGLIEQRLLAVLGRPSRTLLVTDRTVAALHGARIEKLLANLPFSSFAVSPGEEHKHIGSVEQIWRAALAAGADRKSRFIGFGGGVVTDMAGFAAATYMRGVDWIGVPTTLLAMVDASVGGKTGVDLASAKNAVGAFHQPRAVLCDVNVLATESPRGFRSGLAEVVKTALIGDPGLFELLETAPAGFSADSDLALEIVERSVRVKASVVSRDPHEHGARALLNLGHTVGHAIEAAAGYTRLTHGEAVSLGLVAALRIGVKLGHTPVDLAQRVELLLAKLGLPTDLSREPLREAANLIGHDKKRGASKLKFIVAREVGRVEIEELELATIERETLALT
ncbi:MAG TPA: 3-dehydroquinate synthase [Polyangiaceae bacterium]|nr:3-dehydroquinate synthase [Polyangiaceae bacterium]